MTKQILPLLMLLTPATAVFAQISSRIDPISKSYLIQDRGLKNHFEIDRTYSSGSTFRGHFGIGWCSDLDAKVQVLSKGDIAFRSCDTATASRMDHRTADFKIQKTQSGFKREVSSGVIQIFDSVGDLLRVEKNDRILTLKRHSNGRLAELISVDRSSPTRAVSRARVRLFEDGTLANRSDFKGDIDFPLVTSIARFEKSVVKETFEYTYKDALMISIKSLSSQPVRFEYDDFLNMVRFETNRESEIIEYHQEIDELASVTRTTAFGRDRLLVLSGAQDQKSISSFKTEKFELKMEVERGAEMHPVRILYDRTDQTLVMEGDRKWARQLMNWLSVNKT